MFVRQSRARLDTMMHVSLSLSFNLLVAHTLRLRLRRPLNHLPVIFRSPPHRVINYLTELPVILIELNINSPSTASSLAYTVEGIVDVRLQELYPVITFVLHGLMHVPLLHSPLQYVPTCSSPTRHDKPVALIERARENRHEMLRLFVRTHLKPVQHDPSVR